jgi:hypothetical protein
MRTVSIAVVAVLCLAVAGCDHMTHQQQRALSGGAIGAAGGAAITAIAGGPILAGAVLGGAAGTAVGALTK